ncbi:acyl carrier protein [Desulfopila aestuarii]|uniref:Acyl carrier protein n=1 Tax=Desulfopila aestuarii DSM 18488 TaxID=1121416 RepID=A0A1M7Y6K4_9BACT|nr:acyl carrier protein [Desulfopila aestuarii]SHO48295.1 acyl carrier protein [Desulfopila aestuarii DSM 18488]
MDESRIRGSIVGILARIAPEADLAALEPDRRFRDQFEFDSIDCLNLMTAIEKEFGIKIPEEAYPGLSSLNGCVNYLRTL